MMYKNIRLKAGETINISAMIEIKNTYAKLHSAQKQNFDIFSKQIKPILLNSKIDNQNAEFFETRNKSLLNQIYWTS